MSDEEKKAIVELNHFSNMTAYWKQEEYTNSEIDNYIKLVLNFIEKQQKEIEELKEDNKHQWEERCKLTFELENSTSNDKIKAKIIEIKDRPVKDEFITATQGKLDTIIDIESLLNEEE